MRIGCSSPWQAIFFGLKARRKNEGSLRISFSNCGAATAVHVLKLPQIEWFTGVNSSHQQYMTLATPFRLNFILFPASAIQQPELILLYKCANTIFLHFFSNEVASQVFNLICSINDNFNYWVFLLKKMCYNFFFLILGL